MTRWTVWSSSCSARRVAGASGAEGRWWEEGQQRKGCRPGFARMGKAGCDLGKAGIETGRSSPAAAVPSSTARRPKRGTPSRNSPATVVPSSLATEGFQARAMTGCLASGGEQAPLATPQTPTQCLLHGDGGGREVVDPAWWWRAATLKS